MCLPGARIEHVTERVEKIMGRGNEGPYWYTYNTIQLNVFQLSYMSIIIIIH